MPSNTHLIRTVPQIEILNQACLFKTHSGMNSTSKAIHFGVPMICVSMGGGTDQPLNARVREYELEHRVCDQF